MRKNEEKKFAKEISKKIKSARTSQGIYQRVVAENGIVSQTELSKIERGERSIGFLVLIQLANLYNKKIDYFVPEELKPKKKFEISISMGDLNKF